MASVAEPRSPSRDELVLAARPIAASESRRWMRALTAELLSAERRADLDIVLSEIVTNALRHGAPGAKVTVAVTPKPEFLCVQVTDEGPGLVPQPGAMASEENGGFGLFIVEHLSRRWGVTRESARTRVWFEFDYVAASA
jgi:anti-sigma regulatory factor (Ser/Thr protein kinase)